MDVLAVVVVAGVVFGYALVARALDRTVLTGPMLFAAVGAYRFSRSQLLISRPPFASAQRACPDSRSRAER